MSARVANALTVGVVLTAVVVIVLAAPAAPRGKPPAPEFEPVDVTGRWDGDACHQPWLLPDGGGRPWVLVFPGRAEQDVILGPLTRETRVRVRGTAGYCGTCRFLRVEAVGTP